MSLLNQNDQSNKLGEQANHFWAVLAIVLLVGTVFFGVRYFAIQKELRAVKLSLETQTINGKVLEFAKMFIEKVLKADKEVDFETRLKLETAVRNLNDKEIFAQWQKFTEAKTEIQAQAGVKTLLEILVNKIHPVKII